MNYDIVIVYRFILTDKVVERIFFVECMTEEEKEHLHDIAERKGRRVEVISHCKTSGDVAEFLRDLT